MVSIENGSISKIQPNQAKYNLVNNENHIVLKSISKIMEVDDVEIQTIYIEPVALSQILSLSDGVYVDVIVMVISIGELEIISSTHSTELQKKTIKIVDDSKVIFDCVFWNDQVFIHLFYYRSRTNKVTSNGLM